MSNGMPFTKENAAIHGKRGNIIRWSQAIAPVTDTPLPASAVQQAAGVAQAIARENLEYKEIRLVRVRKQLDLIDAAMFKEANKRNPDGRKLRELADAQKRLDEQERHLSDRWVAGTLKTQPRDKDRLNAQSEPTTEPVREVCQVVPPDNCATIIPTSIGPNTPNG